MRTRLRLAAGLMALGAAVSGGGCALAPWSMGAPLNGQPSIPETTQAPSVARLRLRARAERTAGQVALELRTLRAIGKAERLTSDERLRLAELLEQHATQLMALRRPVPACEDLRLLEELAPARARALAAVHAGAERDAGDAWLAIGELKKARAAYELAAALGAGATDIRLTAATGASPPSGLGKTATERAILDLPLRAVPAFAEIYVDHGGSALNGAVLERALRAARQEKRVALAARLGRALAGSGAPRADVDVDVDVDIGLTAAADLVAPPAPPASGAATAAAPAPIVTPTLTPTLTPGTVAATPVAAEPPSAAPGAGTQPAGALAAAGAVAAPAPLAPAAEAPSVAAGGAAPPAPAAPIVRAPAPPPSSRQELAEALLDLPAAPSPPGAPGSPNTPGALEDWVLGSAAVSWRLLPLLQRNDALLAPGPRSRTWADLLLDEDPTSPAVLEISAAIDGLAGRIGGAERKLVDLVYFSPDRYQGMVRTAKVWRRVGQVRLACVAWLRAARWRDEVDDPAWRQAIDCARADPGAGDWRAIRQYVLDRAPSERRPALAAALDPPAPPPPRPAPAPPPPPDALTPAAPAPTPPAPAPLPAPATPAAPLSAPPADVPLPRDTGGNPR